MSAVETEPIRLDNVLGVDVRPGLVDIRGRIIREGVVECEAAGVMQRGTLTGDAGPIRILVPAGCVLGPRELDNALGAIIPYSGPPPRYVGAEPLADVFWYETTMEIHERQHPASWH